MFYVILIVPELSAFKFVSTYFFLNIRFISFAVFFKLRKMYKVCGHFHSKLGAKVWKIDSEMHTCTYECACIDPTMFA